MRLRDPLMRLVRALAAAAALSAALVAPASAGEAAPVADDPVLEKRVTEITEMLRCLVCQNQTIADSHADLAVDLKNQVREMIKAGRSDKEILDYMVARYGEFVLYKPRFEGATLILWIGPFVLLLVGVAVLVVKVKQRRSQAAQGEAAVSEEELARAAALLEEGTQGKGKAR